MCDSCALGLTGGCERVAFGHLKPGLQTGYCADTGGGWSVALAAHESQLHPVPERMSDEDAVMVEPAACAVHAAYAEALPGDLVVVLGAGTLGLCVVAALRRFRDPSTLVAVAKHPEQRRLAADLGADVVVEPGEERRAVRRLTGALQTGAQLTAGANVVVDCVGSADSLADALAVVAPRGHVVLVGMPGVVRVDLTPLWHREVKLSGAYAYGRELDSAGRGWGPRHGEEGGDGAPPGENSTEKTAFELAFQLVTEAGLGRLVSATYELDRLVATP